MEKEIEQLQEIECELGVAIFIHYDNDEKTICTVDINGMWYHINVKTIKPQSGEVL